MADEPSIPMDQEEEDNDEYFSARETQKKANQENELKSSTPTPQKSDRDGEPSGSSSRKKKQAFFTDEAAQQGSENSSTKKSQRVRRLLKDRNRWDMMEYKKEDLEPVAKPKKKKKKKASSKAKKAAEKEEKSKTDEESEEKDEKEDGPTSDSAAATLEPRPFFQSEKLILKCTQEKPIAPKCKFNVLRFGKTQEVVEYDAEGMQPLLGHYNERAISNPWRRWGAHLALCAQGGFLVDKHKKIVEIKRGSDPPPCPPNPRQVTLNKNCELPDSQSMMGTIKVEVGQAEDEVHRIGRVMEEYVKKGGFVPPPMTKKEMQPKPAKGKPQVVVQVKGGKQPNAPSAEKVKGKIRTPKKKNGKPGEENAKTGEESVDDGEDDGVAEKAKKGKEAVRDAVNQGFNAVQDGTKRGFDFFKKKKQARKDKKNNKGSIR